MDNYFYLCSSVRHVFLALGLANSSPNIRHHLLVINQKSVGPVVRSLLSDPGPFSSVEVFEAGSGAWGKLRSKRRCFSRLSELLDALRPVRVFGGNDRRVEFQYAMSQAVKANPDVVGAYLDDGTGSYINGIYLRKWRTVVDMTADRLLKRIVYGSWYDKNRLLGGTRWVKECYLNFPDLAPLELKSRKKILPLDHEIFRADSFKKSLRPIVEAYRESKSGGFDFSSFHKTYDVFVVLPHSRLVKEYFGGFEKYNEILEKYLGDFGSIAVKYHPRETDFYFKSSASVTIFPASLPAELIFSLVQAGRVVGDASSALLSAVWLMPEGRAVCLCPKGLDENPIFSLVKRVPVEIVHH